MRLLLLILVVMLASVVQGGRDFYKILGIPKRASQKQIKKAYRKAAMQWHPDKHPDDQETANAKFIEINNAYEVLSDEDKRAAYDQDVTVLSAATFAKVADTARRGSRVWLVKFYSPSCPHCQSMVKDINALGKGLRGAARVGVVDCTQHSDVCGSQGVRGYPTLKLFGPQGGQDYAGSRSAGGMRNALVGLIPDGLVRVVSGSNPRSLQALRERFCVGRADGRKKACVLLLSSRSQPSPLFKAVAAHVADLEARGKSSSSKLTFVHVDVGLKGSKAALAMGALGMKRDKSARTMLALLHEDGQAAHAESAPSFSGILTWIKAEAQKLRKGK